MASAFGNLNGSGPQQVWLNLVYAGYNQAGNYSSWNWEVRYYGHGYGTWTTDRQTWALSGFAVGGGSFTIPQGEAFLTYKRLGGGTFTKSHDGNGNLAAGTLTARITTDHSSIGSGSVGVSSGTVPRIPKPPTAPGRPVLTQPSATSLTATWAAPGNLNGAALRGYQVQRATNTAFTAGLSTLAPAGAAATFSGLTPGTTYYVRARARNAAGYGAWSAVATRDLWTAPDAPTLHYVSQTGDGTLTVQYDPNYDGGAPVLGYQVGVAADPSFTVTTTQVYSSTTRDAVFPDVAPGTAYVRVRARNSAGYGAWSEPMSTTVTGDVGNLDGWRLVGTLPAGFAPVVGKGLRRTGTGLALEALKTATASPSPVTVTIERDFTGLKEGATYRFEATIQAGAVAYQATLDGYLVSTIPDAFTAVHVPTSPNHTIELTFEITLPETPEVDDWALNVQLSKIKLIEIKEPSPYRLGDTVYEGPLATHFDYACNTVGAGWWVGRDNVVTFREWNDYPAPVAHFSDVDDPGTLGYTDIRAAYDTRNVATVLTISNHGRDAETTDADDADYIGENTAALIEWGRREASVDMTLYEPADYVGARMSEILSQVAAPEQTITGITWNAQADSALASVLEIQDRIDVTFQGTTQRCRILGIKHDVTPTRWMQTLELRKEA